MVILSLGIEMDSFKDLKSDLASSIAFYIAMIMIGSIGLNNIMEFIFCSLARRPFPVNFMLGIDIVLLIGVVISMNIN